MLDAAAIADPVDLAGGLLKLMASPDLASRRWIWEQYDSQVGGHTVQRPGGPTPPWSASRTARKRWR